MQPKLWIVTGANGHFANTLVRELLNQGESVVGFVLPGDKSKALSGLQVPIVEGDVTDITAVKQLIDDAWADAQDICLVHAAGIVSIDFKEKNRIRQVNVGGTKNIAETCLRQDVVRFVISVRSTRSPRFAARPRYRWRLRKRSPRWLKHTIF